MTRVAYQVFLQPRRRKLAQLVATGHTVSFASLTTAQQVKTTNDIYRIRDMSLLDRFCCYRIEAQNDSLIIATQLSLRCLTVFNIREQSPTSAPQIISFPTKWCNRENVTRNTY